MRFVPAALISLALVLTACGDDRSDLLTSGDPSDSELVSGSSDAGADGGGEGPTSTSDEPAGEIATPDTSNGGGEVERADDGGPDGAASDGDGTGSTVTDGQPDPAASQPIDLSGGSVAVAWESLPSRPYYAPPGGGADPFFHIHTNPELDGFFLSFELYTAWGEAWTGQTGTFDISCREPVNSTGICPYFDADGPGPGPVIGDDFATQGSLTITRLDPDGYDITIHELVFGDGTSFEPFTMTG